VLFKGGGNANNDLALTEVLGSRFQSRGGLFVPGEGKKEMEEPDRLGTHLGTGSVMHE